jgi:GTP 3',8-cyclase
MSNVVLDRMNRPLQDLRISVTDKCNFRCTYCMPAHIFGESYKFLPQPQLLTFEEITRLANIFVELGVRKLRITGGEPLLRQELHKLIGMLSQIPNIDDIAMTTNGYFLDKHAQALVENGLHRITISLDSLDDTVFKAMNGNKADVQTVLNSLKIAEKHGLTPIKVNCVVKKGVNDHTLVDMARYCKDNGYILRFIEYMDVGTRNGWQLEHVMPAQEIIELIDTVMPLERLEAEYFGEVAYRYQYKDGGGEMGVIASVTKPFCGTCTRLRLSPEGQIFTCLFGHKGISLRDPMREGATDEELENIIRKTWGIRTDRYSEIRTEDTAKQERIEMYYIGG